MRSCCYAKKHGGYSYDKIFMCVLRTILPQVSRRTHATQLLLAVQRRNARRADTATHFEEFFSHDVHNIGRDVYSASEQFKQCVLIT